MRARRSTRAVGSPRPISVVPRRPFPWWIPIAATLSGGLIWWAPWEPDPVEPIVFSADGPRMTAPMCVAVMIDESGSMADSDPQLARPAALLGASSFLGEFGLATDQVAGGWFADTAEISPLLSAAKGLTELPQDSTVPSGGGTNMVAAIDRAGQTLETCPFGQTPVLVLVTDGVADDFEAVGQAIARLPSGTTTQLLAIDATGSLASVSSEWAHYAPGVEVEPVTALDRDGVGTGMANVLSRLTGQKVSAP